MKTLIKAILICLPQIVLSQNAILLWNHNDIKIERSEPNTVIVTNSIEGQEATFEKTFENLDCVLAAATAVTYAHEDQNYVHTLISGYSEPEPGRFVFETYVLKSNGEWSKESGPYRVGFPSGNLFEDDYAETVKSEVVLTPLYYHRFSNVNADPRFQKETLELVYEVLNITNNSIVYYQEELGLGAWNIFEDRYVLDNEPNFFSPHPQFNGLPYDDNDYVSAENSQRPEDLKKPVPCFTNNTVPFSPKIYPNPVPRGTSLRINAPQTSPIRVRVVNLLGELFYDKKLPGRQNEFILEDLGRDGIKPGWYFVILNDEDNNKHAEKIFFY